MNEIEKRVSTLRKIFVREEIDGYLVPHEDCHFSEYCAENDERLKYISGFSASSGFALISKDKAIAFSDKRYNTQAHRQLDKRIWEFRNGRKFTCDGMKEFINKNFVEENKIAVDPFLISRSDYMDFEKFLETHGIKLVTLSKNLIDEMWDKKESNITKSIFPHELRFSGESSSDKLLKIREKMKNEKCDVLVIASLDEIAWVTNLRGVNLIPYCGTFKSWLIIYETSASLYVDGKYFDEKKFSEIKTEFGKLFKVFPYEKFFGDVKSLKEKELKDKAIWVDPCKISFGISQSFGKDQKLLKCKDSPIRRMKMNKNKVEQRGFRRALVRDCVSLLKFYVWLEETLEKNPESEDLDEYNASCVLENFRKKDNPETFVSTSFETICSVGKNAAVVHYHPTKEDAVERKRINKKEILLLDSGGNYLDGTTDTTRTRHFGQPSEDEKLYYTAVLKGHIAFATLVFPEKRRSSCRINVVPLLPLWKLGYEIPHGTSHGVGTCLNVHEEPYLHPPYEPVENCIITIEPGAYFEDKSFGVRIENMYLVKKASKKNFLALECLTFFPLQRKLILKKNLNRDEISWVNKYHEKCFSILSKFFSKKEDMKYLEWLKKETNPL